MASYWDECGPIVKTVVGVAVAGAGGLLVYFGVNMIHASGSASKQSDATPTMIHDKCRMGKYPRGDVHRFDVPQEKVPWSVDFPEYAPPNFTTPSVLSMPVWADINYMVDTKSPAPKWNEVEGKIDRRSHNGKYKLVDGLPRNPIGRTGLYGRGALGRWGPNHAADPIVSRWKLDKDGKHVIHPKSSLKILQFIAIERCDSGMWAIPGGMVDPGEKVSVTLKREFSEEALDALNMTDKEQHQLEENINELFNAGNQVYSGYVDDPRNTDNAWMETIAVNFHDEMGSTIGRVRLNAGDDAVGVQWTDIDSTLNLYASHSNFIKEVSGLHNAHW